MQASTNPALRLQGIIGSAAISGVAFSGNTGGDFEDAATISTRAYAGVAGDMTGAGDRGAFVPMLYMNATPSDATVETAEGNVKVSDGVVYFRAYLVLSNKGTTTGEVRIRIPATTTGGHPIPIWPVGSGKGVVLVRAARLANGVISEGDAIYGDLINSSGGQRSIRIARFNSSGFLEPITDTALTDTTSLILSGMWWTA